MILWSIFCLFVCLFSRCNHQFTASTTLVYKTSCVDLLVYFLGGLFSTFSNLSSPKHDPQWKRCEALVFSRSLQHLCGAQRCEDHVHCSRAHVWSCDAVVRGQRECWLTRLETPHLCFQMIITEITKAKWYFLYCLHHPTVLLFLLNLISRFKVE